MKTDSVSFTLSCFSNTCLFVEIQRIQYKDLLFSWTTNYEVPRQLLIALSSARVKDIGVDVHRVPWATIRQL